MTCIHGILPAYFPSHGKDLPYRAWTDSSVNDLGLLHTSCPLAGTSLPFQAALRTEDRHATKSPSLPVYRFREAQRNVDSLPRKYLLQNHQSQHYMLFNGHEFPPSLQHEGGTICAEGCNVLATKDHLLHVPMADASLGGNRVYMFADGLWRLIDSKGSQPKEAKYHDDFIVENTQLNRRICSTAIEDCFGATTLASARSTHSKIIEQGYSGHVDVCNALISMYNKCDSFEDACLVLQRLPKPDLVTWNTLITSFNKNEEKIDILYIYKYMQRVDIEPNETTYAYALRACYGGSQLEQGRAIHCRILEKGIDLSSSSHVGNSIVVMYSNCFCLESAHVIFHSLPKRDVVTWNTMIDSYIKLGFVEASVKMYCDMCQRGIQPTLATYVCTLKACSVKRNLQLGHSIHTQLVSRGITLDSIIENTLLDFYCKCGFFEDAHFLFDGFSAKSVITWNTLISGYGLHQFSHLAMASFRQMQYEGHQPDVISFVCALKACSLLSDLQQGRELHSDIVKVGTDNNMVVGNILIAMYGHCGRVDDAESVFDCAKSRDIITWSALMTGYIHDGRGNEVLQMFKQLCSMDLPMDEGLFVCVLKACAQLAALEQGMELHAFILEKGYDITTLISSSLVSMYSKCGTVDMAVLVFNRLDKRCVISYNAMLAMFADHCKSSSSIDLYHSMAHAEITPNSITFTCLLSACRNMNLIDEGCRLFKSMQSLHDVLPEVDHYGCLVDIFGKTGHRSIAEDLIETYPTASNIVCWTSLLNFCEKHSDILLGRRCFNYARLIDATNTSIYIIMSKLYKGAGFLKDFANIEGLRKHRNKWKKPGKAFVEVNKEIFEFVVGDKTHPQSEEVHLKAMELGRTAKRVSSLQDRLLDLPEDIHDNLCGHSEKLAIAFGLLSTNAGTCIRIAKNIRMCADCHTTAKLTSSIENREIIVSDSYCVHNFKDGLCSCKD